MISPIFRVIKVKLTPSLYMKIGDEAVVDLEASPMLKEREITEESFWLIDGSSIVVKTLTPCSLLEEKVDAYLSRGKVRDLYDIYYLSDLCEEKKPLKRLLLHLREPPKDFHILRELIIAGVPPSFSTIVEKVKRTAH